MSSPLADRLRPRTLDEVCGQRHLLAPGCVFRRAVSGPRVPNMIFYGPPGVGKTTVARILAKQSGMLLHQLNGTSAGTADIKSVLADVGTFGAHSGVLLYLDEIQYLNKKQQQSLLECLEDGSVTLIASTTENPYFYVYNALLSRAAVFEFKPLSPEDVLLGLKNALRRLSDEGMPVRAEEGALELLAESCGGDMRKALGNLEFAVLAAREQDDGRLVTRQDAAGAAPRGAMRYDKSGDGHYDCISALQKSIRGSDPGRCGALPCAHFGGGRHALGLQAAAGDSGRGRGPCLPHGHGGDKGLCGQCPAAWHAGGAASPCRGSHPAGHCAQKQQRAQRHSKGGRGYPCGQSGACAAPASKQAF